MKVAPYAEDLFDDPLPKADCRIAFSISSVGIPLLLSVEQSLAMSPGISNRKFHWEVSDLSELAPVLLFVPYLLPWLLFIVFGGRRMTKWLGMLCHGIVAFILIALILLKLDSAEPSKIDLALINVVFVMSLLVFYPAMISTFVLAPLAVLFLILGTMSFLILRGKGYKFQLHEYALLYTNLGRKSLRSLPSRKELLVIPGIVEVSAKELRALYDQKRCLDRA